LKSELAEVFLLSYHNTTGIKWTQSLTMDNFTSSLTTVGL